MSSPVVASRYGVIVDFDGVVARSTGMKYKTLLDSARHVGLVNLDQLILALDAELNGADRARVGHWLQDQMQRPGIAESFVNTFTSQWSTRTETVKPTEGFIPFIEAIQRSDARVCVVSLAPAQEITTWLRTVMDPANFAGIFGIECGPKIVTTRLAIDRLRVVATSVMCIGDTPADFTAAAQFGCRFIRMHSAVGDRCDWSSYRVPTVTSFADLPSIFKAEFGIDLGG